MTDGPPAELCCPITDEVFKEPVILVETGQTYERTAIEHWFARGRTTDPLTGKELSNTQVVPNYAIKGLVQTWLESRGINGFHATGEPAEGEGQTRYPAVYNGTPNDKIAQAADMLKHLQSPSIEIAAYRNGCIYHLFQLTSLAKDEACRNFLLHEGAVKTLVPLLIDQKLAEGTARLLSRLITPTSATCFQEAGEPKVVNLISFRVRRSGNNMTELYKPAGNRLSLRGTWMQVGWTNLLS
jgi:hypothetical protein